MEVYTTVTNIYRRLFLLNIFFKMGNTKIDQDTKQGCLSNILCGRGQPQQLAHLKLSLDFWPSWVDTL